MNDCEIERKFAQLECKIKTLKKRVTELECKPVWYDTVSTTAGQIVLY